VLQLFSNDQELEVNVGVLYFDLVYFSIPIGLLLLVSLLYLAYDLILDVMDGFKFVHYKELLLVL
jgi:hypothetical protein